MNKELGRWRSRAELIPDRRLRTMALETQRGERGNLEGAAAFAVLVPRARREAVVRAAVCFQALCDYLDTITELPLEGAGHGCDQVARTRSLHRAMLMALDPSPPVAPPLDLAYDDGGYLTALTDESRAAARSLPSWSRLAGEAIAAARRTIVYQSLAHGGTPTARRELACWAGGLTPGGSGLMWWETAAGTASSLPIFALLSAAARPEVSGAEATALSQAYFPWISALHVLLDSLVDWSADVERGHWSLVAHYSSQEQMTDRLAKIAARAIEAAHTTRHGRGHALILGAMASFYLSRPAARTPQTQPAAERVLAAIGSPAKPAMAVLTLRATVERMTTTAHRATNSSLGPVTRNSSI